MILFDFVPMARSTLLMLLFLSGTLWRIFFQSVNATMILNFKHAASVVAACPSFTSSMEEGRAVCPVEELTYTCTFANGGSVVQITSWNISHCSSIINTVHVATNYGKVETCGPFSVQVNNASDGDCYTSTLTVTALPELNGTVIQCVGGEISGRFTILVLGKNFRH